MSPSFPSLFCTNTDFIVSHVLVMKAWISLIDDMMLVTAALMWVSGVLLKVLLVSFVGKSMLMHRFENIVSHIMDICACLVTSVVFNIKLQLVTFFFPYLLKLSLHSQRST